MFVPMLLVRNSVEAEKEELKWLLSSGVLGRSNHLARMLSFICEKHFEGQDDQVKEYTIAVEALGRRSDFDPQVDTIVRVTAHSLRKRLQEIYRGEGANRPVHILIPAGHYVPAFVHVEVDRTPAEHLELAAEASSDLELVQPKKDSGWIAALPDSQTKRSPRWLALAPLLVVAGLVAGFFVASQRRVVEKEGGAAGSGEAFLLPKDTIRGLIGTGRRIYVDHSGNTWAPDKYCTTGTSVTLPEQKIVGTEDPYLYLGGVRGIAHCAFPVKPGEYEMHFHFAETSDLEAATRPVVLSVNAGPDISFDVVDHAGGDGIATSRVLTGVRPENDGSIHLDLTSEVSLLNAVEILPAASEALLPVRITMGPAAVTDSANQLWLSDRYFNGGRRGQLSRLSTTANLGIYGSDRVGRVRYNVPVVPHEKYRVTLFFYEPWFGKHNGASGGAGSRVFDVSCNGNPMLRNFDIMAEGGAYPVVKSFDNIEATTQGDIELSFMPVVNHPVVNAIEVVPEPER